MKKLIETLIKRDYDWSVDFKKNTLVYRETKTTETEYEIPKEMTFLELSYRFNGPKNFKQGGK